jgi:hypothetical protein
LFFREHLLELWRRDKSAVAVSRLTCTFAHENEQQAKVYAGLGEAVLPVVPLEPTAAHARLDMLWLTWMSEPGATTDKVLSWCASYWAGDATQDLSATALSSWELLYACPLVVVSRA